MYISIVISDNRTFASEWSEDIDEKEDPAIAVCVFLWMFHIVLYLKMCPR